MGAEATRVLVVEHDPQSLKTLTAALSVASAGFRVATVDRLGTAIERLRTGGFDVVLLDLALPDSSGLGTFARLYAEAPDTPIVVLAGADDETTALKAVKSGAQDYLIKDQVHATLLERSLRYAIERRRSEEQIALQARLLEAVGEAVIATDRDGTIRYWNGFAERLYGWNGRAVLARNILDVLPAAPEQARARQVLQSVADGEPWSGEMELQRRDGTTFPAQVVHSPIRDVVGELIGIVGTSSDITERKRGERALLESEQRLRQNEQRFRCLVENATDMIGVLDADFRVRYASPSVRTILGYDAAWLMDAVAFDLVHPNDREAALEALGHIRGNDRLLPTLEVRVRHRDGSFRTVEVKARNLLDDPAINGIVLNARDITERTQAQDALRESNDALTALITASPVAIIALDADGCVTMWNQTAERLFGWREDETLGGALPILPEAGRDAHRTRLASSLAGGSSAGVEIVCRRRDGTDIDVSLSAGPLRDASGRVKGVVAVFEDLSPRKELEERLLHSQKMEAIGRLAGGIAHDFNNLLTAITGHAQILLEGIPDGDPARADLFEIDRAAARAASLTRQLLAFSRKQVLQPAVIDVNALVSSSQRMLRRLIGVDVELVTVLDPATGRIKADPGQIEQVIMNLVVNARDAMPGGGTIVIETSNHSVTTDHPTALAGAAPGDYVLLALTDSGVGMDRDTLSHIFEPFFTTKEAGKGTGLGLSTVYGIVNQSGGHIWAYSEPNHGTVFKVLLPRVRSRAEARPVRIEHDDRSGSETILLVEDESAVRALAHRVLERYGYRVLSAASGDEAIELARGYAGEIHLMVTDVVMPGLSGGEVAERIRTARPTTAVLYTSGYTPDATLQHHVIAAGAPFLQKPFTPPELAAKVRDVLDAAVVVGGKPAK